MPILLFLLAILVFLFPLNAKSFNFVSVNSLKKDMLWFTKTPHPFASLEQKQFANELAKILKASHGDIQIQSFVSQIPENDTPLFQPTNNPKNFKSVTGYNIISTYPGTKNCSIIIGGHYDTKFFSKFRFIGANDGGSSSVLMLALAKIFKNLKRNQNTLSACSLSLVFFDGEEAHLLEWNKAHNIYGLDDNLYGSRYFVKNLTRHKKHVLFNKKVLKLVLVIDMIGHQEQKLSITKGSNIYYLKKLIDLNKSVNIQKADFLIADDHSPFLELKNLDVVHIIDWTNIKEWHTEKDTPEIISYEKISKFLDLIIKFLTSE